MANFDVCFVEVLMTWFQKRTSQGASCCTAPCPLLDSFRALVRSGSRDGYGRVPIGGLTDSRGASASDHLRGLASQQHSVCTGSRKPPPPPSVRRPLAVFIGQMCCSAQRRPFCTMHSGSHPGLKGPPGRDESHGASTCFPGAVPDLQGCPGLFAE